MATDTGPAADVPGWYMRASLAYLRAVRFALWCRVLSPRRALTVPWHIAATQAGAAAAGAPLRGRR